MAYTVDDIQQKKDGIKTSLNRAGIRMPKKFTAPVVEQVDDSAEVLMARCIEMLHGICDFCRDRGYSRSAKSNIRKLMKLYVALQKSNLSEKDRETKKAKIEALETEIEKFKEINTMREKIKEMCVSAQEAIRVYEDHIYDWRRDPMFKKCREWLEQVVSKLGNITDDISAEAFGCMQKIVEKIETMIDAIKSGNTEPKSLTTLMDEVDKQLERWRNSKGVTITILGPKGKASKEQVKLVDQGVDELNSILKPIKECYDVYGMLTHIKNTKNELMEHYRAEKEGYIHEEQAEVKVLREKIERLKNEKEALQAKLINETLSDDEQVDIVEQMDDIDLKIANYQSRVSTHNGQIRTWEAFISNYEWALDVISQILAAMGISEIKNNPAELLEFVSYLDINKVYDLMNGSDISVEDAQGFMMVSEGQRKFMERHGAALRDIFIPRPKESEGPISQPRGPIEVPADNISTQSQATQPQLTQAEKDRQAKLARAQAIRNGTASGGDSAGSGGVQVPAGGGAQIGTVFNDQSDS